MRGTGIIFLIFSLLHAPLPQPDFHNIRHHDAPGEVCEHHDHLLRWHPGAGLAEDVAVLHWHWFLPSAGPTDLPPADGGPALHAHVADWFASTWNSAPRLAPDGHSRLIVRPDSTPQGHVLAVFGPAVWAVVRGSRSNVPCAPLAPCASLLQRWTC